MTDEPKFSNPLSEHTGGFVGRDGDEGIRPDEIAVVLSAGGAMSDEPTHVGQIVTRTGLDRHKVVSIDPDWGTLEVKCIDPGGTGIWVVGEKETNLIARYTAVWA